MVCIIIEYLLAIIKSIKIEDNPLTEQKFLQDLEKKLWTSANKLLPSLDAAVYKHVVLGMVFVKYVSDSFETRRQELMKAFKDPENDYYLGDDSDDL